MYSNQDPVFPALYRSYCKSTLNLLVLYVKRNKYVVINTSKELRYKMKKSHIYCSFKCLLSERTKYPLLLF